MHYKIIDVEKALSLENTIFIDVRSEKEYNESTIPGAINFPILDNQERTIVGEVYKKRSKEEAKSLGLRFASKKLESFYNKVLKLQKSFKNIIIFCWRGGMRSQSICSILSTLNINNVYQLKGGYKSYRKFVLNFIEKKTDRYYFIVLHGLTGVGKTTILNKLKNLNVPVINFENIAKNSGSVFGNIFYLEKSPSQKNFDAIVFNKLYYNTQNYIVVESESKRLGNINIPDPIINSMKKGYHLLIETSLNNRIENIYSDYIKQKDNIDELLIKAISHLKKRLGNKNVELLIEKIKNKDYRFVIRYLIENYYDPLYKYSINKIKIYDAVIEYELIDDAVDSIKNLLDNVLFINEKGVK